MKITIRQSDITTALNIMKEVSEWLAKKGMPLWNPSDFENGKFIKTIKEEDLYTAYIDNIPVATMVLQWTDLEFWPNSIEDSGFIHKFCVKREFSGRGIANEFIKWAIDEVRKRKRKFLRLDCAADRPKLCKVYENNGFTSVGRKMIGQFDTAFYELVV